MKCSVPGCDTDEHVVSYTSVFFVNFPAERNMQDEWIRMLNITDTNHISALLTGDLKVCSCHFTEDCFGRHPVYGYRYLLPEALPTIVADQHMGELFAEDLVQSDDANVEPYYLKYGAETPVHRQLQPMQHAKDVPSAMQSEDNSVESVSLFGDDEDVDEVYIKYFDGNFYFIRSEEPDKSGDVPEDFEPEPDSESCSSVRVDDVDASINCNDDFSNNELQEKTISEGVSEDVDVVNSHADESSEEECLELEDEAIGEAVDKDTATEQLDGQDEENEDHIVVDGNGTTITPQTKAVTSQSNHTPSDEDEPVTARNGECSATESTGYGSIEALDEVIVRGSKAHVQTTNEKERRHVCSDCGKAFSYPSGLAKHALVHSKTKPFTCDICETSFSQKVNLKVHMRRHTGERPVARFTCEVCGKKCIRRSELRLHLNSHRKQYPIVCPGCDSRFVNVTTLYTHLRQEHKDDEITMQQVLEKFSENGNPQIFGDKHQASDPGETMGPDGRWDCPVCSRRFAHLRTLRKHKRKLHPKVFCCRYCQRTFPYRSMLEKHLPVHTLEKRFRCEQCSSSFSQRSNLSKHIQSKHSEIIQIAKNIDEEDVLMQDAGESTGNVFECSRCAKSFFRKTTWLAHLETHKLGNEQQPTCDQCNMTFASQASLRTHCRRMHRSLKMLSSVKLRVTDSDSSLDRIDELNDEDEQVEA